MTAGHAEPGLAALERLLALEAIRTLKARRVIALDTKDWATYASLHAEDHVSETLAGGPVQGGQALTDALARMFSAATTVHHVHTPVITFDGPDKASGVWAMEDAIFWKEDGQPHWCRGAGVYHERYVRRDGRWLFTYRRLDRLHVEVSPGSRFSYLAVDRSGEQTHAFG